MKCYLICKGYRDPMRKSLFNIDGGTCYEGYTNGSLWNGWACPYFTKEVAMQIANDYTDMMYDATTDSFIFDAVDEYGPYTFESIDVDGMHLYAIGTRFWIWEEQK